MGNMGLPTYRVLTHFVGFKNGIVMMRWLWDFNLWKLYVYYNDVAKVYIFLPCVFAGLPQATVGRPRHNAP